MLTLRNVLSLACVLGGGCMSPSDSPPPELKSDAARDQAPGVASSDLGTFVDGTTQFGLDLYGQARGSAAGKNIIMSPLSVTEALGMTYAGAGGDTAAQMKSTLHFTLPDATTQSAMDQVDLALGHDGDHATSKTRPFELHVADALWAQHGFPFQQPYLDTLATDYGAGVFVQDFAKDPEGSRDTINHYISDQTGGTIPELLPEGNITSDTVFVLTNAIYMDAAWANPFDPSDTASGSFTRDDGTAVQAQMMNGVDGIAYGSGSDYVAGELAYDGGSIVMDVILPTDTATGAIGRLESSLDQAKLAAVLASIDDTASISMPKVKYHSQFDLKDSLEALGMTDAFGDADFSAMSPEQIVITDVVHQGFIEVDENGTTASGATAVTGAGAGAPGPNRLVLDHPYVVVIRDVGTGSVLFFGRVMDPTAS
nr:serpin family protein [Kofleriaceae bacterium]